VRLDTRGREQTAAAGDGAVEARDARRGREAAVGTPACGPDIALKARERRGTARARGSHAATAR
jgi:hypothetical protein